MELRATSGKINLNNSILPDSLSVDITSGKVNVSIPENEGFNLDYKVTSGKFNTDFYIYSNITGDHKRGNGKYKNGGNTFTVKVTSGNVNLNKNI